MTNLEQPDPGLVVPSETTTTDFAFQFSGPVFGGTIEMLGIKTADRDWGLAGRIAAQRLKAALEADYKSEEVDHSEARNFSHLLR